MLHLNLFGEQRLTAWGADVVAGRSRALELLAYLVLHPGIGIPRLVLAGTFWPESTDAQALTNLRRELHNLRAALGEVDCLDTVDGTIAWLEHPGMRADVQVFAAERTAAEAAAARGDGRGFLAHAETAVAAYRGELMPGNYGDWVLAVRDRLLGECSQLCADATAGWLALGQGRRALASARQRLVVAPLEEAGYRELIRVQLSLGENAAAMYTFHKCAELLENELGVGPGEETRALVSAMLPGPGAAVQPARATSGRDRETARLRRAWDAAAGGHRSMVLLSGGQGVGKTHLAEQLAARARAEGALVARARCVDAGGLIPLAPVAGWLRTSGFAPVLAGLPPAVKREVGRLLPGLSGENAEPRQAAGTTEVRAMVDAWQRYRFFEALARAVGSAGRPVLLVLDDLHWCDSDTAAWMSFLLAGPYAEQLLLVATMRSGGAEPAPAVVGMLASLHGSGVLHEVAVKPLGLGATAELAGKVRGRAVRPDQARLLHAATGGYPLFIREAAGLLPEADEPQPAGFGAVLGRRLEQLTPGACHLAELAAAYGREINLDLLSEAADLDGKALVAAVDELWRLGILLPVGNGYDFGHHLLRQAAYERVTPANRWLLHRRLAQSLELLHAGDLDPVAALLAEQYALGSNPAKALGFALRAGAAAAKVFANSTALASYRRALELISAMPAGRERDEAELSVRCSMSPPLTALLGYSSAELLDCLERSAELARLLGKPRIHAASLIGLFAGRYVQGRIALSYGIGRHALELSGEDSDLRGQAHFAVAGAALALGRPAEAIEHFAACYGSGQPGYSYILGTRLEIHARAWASHAHWLAGDAEGALRLGAEALTRSAAANHPYTRAVALAYVALLRQLAGDKPGMEAATAELLELCRRYDIAYYGQWGEILAGWSAGGGPGIARIRAGIGALEQQGALARMPYWHSLLADALSSGGQRDRALAELDTALELAREHEERWWTPELLRRRAGLEGNPNARTPGERHSS